MHDAGTNKRVPDFVFLAHVVDIMSAMHSPFVLRSFGSTPFTTRLFLLPMWPFTFGVMLVMWARSKTFLFSFYNLRGHLHQTWVVPRFGFQVSFPFSFLLFPFFFWIRIFSGPSNLDCLILIQSKLKTEEGLLNPNNTVLSDLNNDLCDLISSIFFFYDLQYFLPFATEGINKHIEEAILRADRLGVKVLSLAALNKVSFSDLSLSPWPYSLGIAITNQQKDGYCGVL